MSTQKLQHRQEMKIKKAKGFKTERVNTCDYDPDTGTITRTSPIESEVEPLDGFVYLIQAGETKHFKLGRAKNLQRRLSELQTGNPLRLKIIKSWKTVDAISLEEIFHKILKPHHVMGEWFELSSLGLIEKCEQYLCSPEGKWTFTPNLLTETDRERLHEQYSYSEEEKDYWDNLSYEDLE